LSRTQVKVNRVPLTGREISQLLSLVPVRAGRTLTTPASQSRRLLVQIGSPNLTVSRIHVTASLVLKTLHVSVHRLPPGPLLSIRKSGVVKNGLPLLRDTRTSNKGSVSRRDKIH
ncbi:hypothetical protein AB0M54_47695, partial [Actinoplanes sp. NPDC051470]|uniref:hypothetical protein n=1 Tax=Actinoplanes sp. NPDC051470 TaxID=3157224 RepID=UPI00344AB465